MIHMMIYTRQDFSGHPVEAVENEVSRAWVEAVLAAGSAQGRDLSQERAKEDTEDACRAGPCKTAAKAR